MMLSVLIVNYNVCYFLEHCLLSVRAAAARVMSTYQWDVEVLVCDNNSSDNSIAYLTPLFPEVRFNGVFENLGFSKANNHLLQEATGKYILFLNPDTLLPEDCFTRVIGLMESKPAAGACGVRMVDGSGAYLPESKRGYPGPWNAFTKMIGLANLFPRKKTFAGYYEGHLDDNRNHEVAILSGAFMMVRCSVLETVGVFDEQFFMYGEDIDLSYRITRSGFKNIYCAETTMVHFKGESTLKDPEYYRRFYTAMILFLKKHFRGSTSTLYIGLLRLLIRFKAKRATVKDSAASGIASKSRNMFLEGDSNSINRIRSICGSDDDIAKRGSDTVNEHGKNIFCTDKQIADIVVYCVGAEFSMLDFINALQKDGDYRKRIFQPDAGALIGSDSKETRGSVEITWRS